MQEFSTEFTAKNLTGNAGLTHFGRFAGKLGIRRLLDETITIERGDTATYQVGDIIMMTMMGALAGAKHMSHMAFLRNDSVIRTLFSWTRFPDDTTFSRVFKLFDHLHCNELSEVESQARKKVWSKKWFGRVTLDMDSSVIGVTGEQEGAEVGYNPKKKGQPSYHPLFCFIDETRECFHNWFRCGSAYSANGSVDFMKECLARLPKRVWKIFVRADSAFFDGALLDLLESVGAKYLIKVKMKDLEKKLSGKNWAKVKNQPGVDATEFVYQCHGWKKARRFVAVRKLVSVETEGLLIPKLTYDYFCYVVNESYTPWEAHKKYAKRATSENWIEWCKNQLAAGTIRTDDFWATSAIFQTCIMAYNLLCWMMLLHQRKHLSEEPGTIRRWFIHTPAKLIHRARRYILTLPINYVFKDRWGEIENTLSALSF